MTRLSALLTAAVLSTLVAESHAVACTSSCNADQFCNLDDGLCTLRAKVDTLCKSNVARGVNTCVDGIKCFEFPSATFTCRKYRKVTEDCTNAPCYDYLFCDNLNHGAAGAKCTLPNTLLAGKKCNAMDGWCNTGKTYCDVPAKTCTALKHPPGTCATGARECFDAKTEFNRYGTTKAGNNYCDTKCKARKLIGEVCVAGGPHPAPYKNECKFYHPYVDTTKEGGDATRGTFCLRSATSTTTKCVGYAATNAYCEKNEHCHQPARDGSRGGPTRTQFCKLSHHKSYLTDRKQTATDNTCQLVATVPPTKRPTRYPTKKDPEPTSRPTSSPTLACKTSGTGGPCTRDCDCKAIGGVDKVWCRNETCAAPFSIGERGCAPDYFNPQHPYGPKPQGPISHSFDRYNLNFNKIGVDFRMNVTTEHWQCKQDVGAPALCFADLANKFGPKEFLRYSPTTNIAAGRIPNGLCVGFKKIGEKCTSPPDFNIAQLNSDKTAYDYYHAQCGGPDGATGYCGSTNHCTPKKGKGDACRSNAECGMGPAFLPVDEATFEAQRQLADGARALACDSVTNTCQQPCAWGRMNGRAAAATAKGICGTEMFCGVKGGLDNANIYKKTKAVGSNSYSTGKELLLGDQTPHDFYQFCRPWVENGETCKGAFGDRKWVGKDGGWDSWNLCRGSRSAMQYAALVKSLGVFPTTSLGNAAVTDTKNLSVCVPVGCQHVNCPLTSKDWKCVAVKQTGAKCEGNMATEMKVGHVSKLESSETMQMQCPFGHCGGNESGKMVQAPIVCREYTERVCNARSTTSDNSNRHQYKSDKYNPYNDMPNNRHLFILKENPGGIPSSNGTVTITSKAQCAAACQANYIGYDAETLQRCTVSPTQPETTEGRPTSWNKGKAWDMHKGMCPQQNGCCMWSESKQLCQYRTKYTADLAAVTSEPTCGAANTYANNLCRAGTGPMTELAKWDRTIWDTKNPHPAYRTDYKDPSASVFRNNYIQPQRKYVDEVAFMCSRAPMVKMVADDSVCERNAGCLKDYECGKGLTGPSQLCIGASGLTKGSCRKACRVVQGRGSNADCKEFKNISTGAFCEPHSTTRGSCALKMSVADAKAGKDCACKNKLKCDKCPNEFYCKSDKCQPSIPRKGKCSGPSIGRGDPAVFWKRANDGFAHTCAGFYSAAGAACIPKNCKTTDSDYLCGTLADQKAAGTCNKCPTHYPDGDKLMNSRGWAGCNGEKINADGSVQNADGSYLSSGAARTGPGTLLAVALGLAMAVANRN